jgi:peptidoglycan/xylan/chitin deacetylase (PgdA/CDA1 family)
MFHFFGKKKSRPCQQVPVLTYHSIHVDGSDYANNDHIGFAEDLEWIHRLGFYVISLQRLILAVTSGDWRGLPERSVVLTMDDGSWFDWHDLPHPKFGKQRSMVNILRDFQRRHGRQAQPDLQATSFVIGSPVARQALDKSCMIGLDWWQDDWWQKAHAEGLLKVANHSWDHRHGSLPKALHFSPESAYGQFTDVCSQEESDWQIRQAQDYLQKLLGQSPVPAFAYPFGDVSPYVAEHYLPKEAEGMGLSVALTTEAAPVTPDSKQWQLPRFVFRQDWKDPAELEKILAGSY